MSLGGGAVMSERVREALRDHVAVWCQVEPDTAWERASRNDRRPLAADEETFRELYAQRLPIYEQVARAVLPEGGREVGSASAPWLDAMRSRPGLRLAWARSQSAQYPAAVGEGALELLDTDAAATLGVERWFAVADREALAHHRALLPATQEVIDVEAGEERKTLAEAEEVLRELARAGARRDDGLLAFGGGVVGDLGGPLRRALPARRAGRPGADDARRPGRLRLRRQDRRRPPRGQELRRRLPPCHPPCSPTRGRSRRSPRSSLRASSRCSRRR